jgi:hypothetical protein
MQQPQACNLGSETALERSVWKRANSELILKRLQKLKVTRRLTFCVKDAQPQIAVLAMCLQTEDDLAQIPRTVTIHRGLKKIDSQDLLT